MKSRAPGPSLLVLIKGDIDEVRRKRRSEWTNIRSASSESISFEGKLKTDVSSPDMQYDAPMAAGQVDTDVPFGRVKV